jgi:hypothetical protein
MRIDRFRTNSKQAASAKLDLRRMRHSHDDVARLQHSDRRSLTRSTARPHHHEGAEKQTAGEGIEGEQPGGGLCDRAGRSRRWLWAALRRRIPHRGDDQPPALDRWICLTACSPAGVTRPLVKPDRGGSTRCSGQLSAELPSIGWSRERQMRRAIRTRHHRGPYMDLAVG